MRYSPTKATGIRAQTQGSPILKAGQEPLIESHRHQCQHSVFICMYFFFLVIIMIILKISGSVKKIKQTGWKIREGLGIFFLGTERRYSCVYRTQ